MPKSRVSLQDYLSKHPPRGRCSVCELAPDLLTEINDAMHRGVGAAPIVRWLESLGHLDVTESAARGHKGRNHHKRAQA